MDDSIKGFRLNEDQHLRWPYTFEEIAKPTKGCSTYIDSYPPNAVIETLLLCGERLRQII